MEIFISDELAPAIGPYCHAARVGNLLFISGQVPVDRGGRIIGSDMAEQTAQTLKNLAIVLKASGLAIENVVKTTVYLADINAFGQMNAVYSEHFGDHKPARACVEVSRLANDMLVEIDAIAEFA